MPPLMKKIVDVLIDLICTATCIYTTYLAVVICANLGAKVTAYLRLPFIVDDAAIVVGFALMSVYSVIKLVNRIKGLLRPGDGQSGE